MSTMAAGVPKLASIWKMLLLASSGQTSKKLSAVPLVLPVDDWRLVVIIW